MNGLAVATRGLRSQKLLSLLCLLCGIGAAWKIGGFVAAEDLRSVGYWGVGAAVLGIAVVILRRWRTGLYIFFVWLLFEDLARKYLGNNMLIYFAKDGLAVVIYLSFFIALRRERKVLFRFPFLPFLILFIWLGVMQCFNPGSPSLFYGFLGLRLYFFYIPLIYVGYSLAGADADLRRFLQLSIVLAGLIALLGIVQSIRGPSFLNPRILSPYLEDLSTLRRYAPVSGASIYQPNSVFVSAGRFDMYLDLAWVLGLGYAGYLLLYRRRAQWIALVCLSVIAIAAEMCGGRGAFMYVLGSGIILPVAFLWGASKRPKQAGRIFKLIGRSIAVGGISMVIAIFIFPDALGARWAYYTETMLSNGPDNAITARLESYTPHEFATAFQQGGWVLGHGIGTASLGVQYISGMLGVPRPDFGVESGLGNIVLEFGIFGFALWLCWTAALLICSWKVVLKLRGTPYFPLGFSILWFAFLILYPITFGTLTGVQDYIYSAYLWFLIGVLYRLPDLVSSQTASAVLAPSPSS